MTTPTCPKCKTPEHVLLRRQLAGNGSTQFLWWCRKCQCIDMGNGGPFIKKSTLTEWKRIGKLKVNHLNDIPLLADYRFGVCVVCGKAGTEEHHWMPQCFREIVDDFERWPKASLCSDCHRRWHEIVTHYMNGYGGELGNKAKEILRR